MDPNAITLHVLGVLMLVLVVARSLGAIFRRIHQPPVIGEIVAGIVLGPSLLGAVAPGILAVLMPPEIAPHLSIISQVGVILYMFLVGLALDVEHLRQQGLALVAVSQTSIVVPFLLGCLLAAWLYPGFAPPSVAFGSFALFLGVSMSVTAFPVLARVLTDQGLHRSFLGAVALACAAVDDVTAWCLLAFVVGVVRADPGDAIVTILLTAAFIAAMLLLVRPVIARVTERNFRGQDAVAVACAGLLLSAIATEWIGIHAIFGAFLLGAIVPHDSALARQVRARLEDLVVVLLLPVFFAVTGLRTRIGLLTAPGDWGTCLVICVVASLGKFGGASVAARAVGLTWPHAALLGILMNTRGLMELIVLNVGFDLGILSPKLFAMLVLMAIATTAATSPLLGALGGREALGADSENAESQSSSYTSSSARAP